MGLPNVGERRPPRPRDGAGPGSVSVVGLPSLTGTRPAPAAHDAGRPLVSVVLPTNRKSPFLREALETVAAQSYPRWELIVVDNGVGDDDWLAEQLAGLPRTRVVTAPPVTLALARNAGFAEARGELVVFHDDDDVWAQDRLEVQVAALSQHPDAPACYVGGWHMDAEGRRFGPAFDAARHRPAEMLRGSAKTPHICGTLMLRRPAVATVGGFAPELAIMEDFEFMLRLLTLGEIVAVPGERLGYRRHEANMTQTSLVNLRRRRLVMEESLRRLAWAARMRGEDGLAGLYEEHLRRLHRHACAEAGGTVLARLRRGDLRAAAAETGWAVRRSPAAFVGSLLGRLARLVRPVRLMPLERA